MHVHPDYETVDILAVFPRPELADAAARRVREMVSDTDSVLTRPLPAGRYALADTSVADVARGAGAGVPIGAVVGLGVGAALTGAGPVTMAGLALAGMVGGLVIGGMSGAIARTRWNRDPADGLDVSRDGEYTLLHVHASPALGRREAQRVMRELMDTGAIAFLDPTAYFARREAEKSVAHIM